MKCLVQCMILCLLFCYCGQGQPSNTDKPVGGACERCDDMYAGMPSAAGITSTLRLADDKEPGERMILHGSVMQKDGKTPASGIILYIYHTNAKGIYAAGDQQVHARSHGRLRGWVKTDAEGKFTINSIRPAPYPNGQIPAHIHIMVKEPGKTRYYIDEVWFDDDPFVTKSLRERAEKRGGDMIIHLTKKNDTWESSLPIRLGLNIPNY
jgi:protocatechuate 3,4-dioxygenase beta subunit